MISIFVHRLLQSFLLPPLNAIIIILLGVYYFKLQRTKGLILILLGMGFLYLQSIPYVAYRLNRVIAPPVFDINQLNQVQAIVMLGGGINTSADEYEAVAISNADTFLRIRYTAFLARKNPELPIFASGGTINNNDSEASLIKKVLQDEFHIKNPIYLEPDSKRTIENAKYTAQMIQKYGISKVVLVSSASHLRRAGALFQKNGINVMLAPTGFYGLGYREWRILWFIPSAYAMLTISSIMREFIAYEYDLHIN